MPSYCAIHIWCNFSSVRNEAATMGGHGLRILFLISFVFLTSSFNLNSNYSRALYKPAREKSSFGYSISFHQENGKTWWHSVFFSDFLKNDIDDIWKILHRLLVGAPLSDMAYKCDLAGDITCSQLNIPSNSNEDKSVMFTCSQN